MRIDCLLYKIDYIFQKERTEMGSAVVIAYGTKSPFKVLVCWFAFACRPKVEVAVSQRHACISPRKETHHRFNVPAVKTGLLLNDALRFGEFALRSCFENLPEHAFSKKRFYKFYA